jgi:NADH:ubiquinone oxidoreductase subunit 6 (subunit J)
LIVFIYLIVSLSNWPYLLQLVGYDLFLIRDILPQTQAIINFLGVLAFTIIDKSFCIIPYKDKIVSAVLLILAVLLFSATAKNNKSELFLIFHYFSYIPVIILFNRITTNYSRKPDLNIGFLVAFYLTILFSLIIKFTLQYKSQYISGTSWGFGNFSNLVALTSLFVLPNSVSAFKAKRYLLFCFIFCLCFSRPWSFLLTIQELH